MGGGPRPRRRLWPAGRFRHRLLGRVRGSLRRFHGWARRWRRRGHARSAARTCATTCASRWKRPITGVQKTINVPDLGHLRRLPRHRAPKAGPNPSPARPARGMGKVRAQQGFFTVERTCPTCNGMGQIIKNPCRNCGGARPDREGTRAVGQHPAGRGDRHPHPPGRRGRGRPARRADGRSLHLHRGEGASDLPARRREPLLPRAGQHAPPPRLAARSRCRPSTAARARVKVPAGSQTGKQMRLRAKGMPALRGGGHGRHADRAGGGNAGEPDRAPEGTSARVREAERGEQPGRLDPSFRR